MNYYNEHDSKAAAWLRYLIKQGHIPNGDVDERGIENVQPSDLRGYTQCHFFAGIGGWSLALKLAGWPANRPVWTGSCPCQPFSVAGKGKGTEDERHLWPVFAELIRQCKPPIVFGEQVASKAGRTWLSGVFADLERMGYQRAGADLCAAGVGAPHIRQRLYWVAKCDEWQRVVFAGECDEDGNCSVYGIDYAACGCPGPTQDDEFEYSEQDGIMFARRMVNMQQQRPQGFDGPSVHGSQSGRVREKPIGSIAEAGFWSDANFIQCRDGKTRRIPTEPAFFPLAHGISARVVRMRGYGNAIVPQVAAEFIQATNEAINLMP